MQWHNTKMQNAMEAISDYAALIDLEKKTQKCRKKMTFVEIAS